MGEQRPNLQESLRALADKIGDDWFDDFDADDLRRAADLIERLPVTADGVPVVPGDKVYHPESVVSYPSIVTAGEEGSCGPENFGWFVDVPSGISRCNFICKSFDADIIECYAHRENAEQAKGVSDAR